MLVNLLVPGTIHLRPLVRHLHELNVLNFFTYSHALSTTPASLGLPEDKAVNLWAKEYFTRGHLKLMGWRFSDALFPLYLGLWESGALRNWHRSPVAHALLWGAARKLLRRAKAEGSATLGLVVNAHPAHVVTLLTEEADRLGIKIKKYKNGFSPSHLAMLEEIEYCDYLHAESEFTRESFVAHGFPRENVHLVRQAQDLSRFYPATDGERRAGHGRFRVVSVGQISLRKGQVHLLEAWRRLALPQGELTMIGALDEQIEKPIRAYSEYFTHIPHVPNSALRSHLVQASVMVVPSIEDGHTLVVGEALACGVPVITTSNNGAADLIHDGVNGYVVPASSSDAIGEKLERLYRDPALLKRLAEGTRATISELGAWPERAREYAELYRRIASRQFG